MLYYENKEKQPGGQIKLTANYAIDTTMILKVH